MPSKPQCVCWRHRAASLRPPNAYNVASGKCAENISHNARTDAEAILEQLREWRRPEEEIGALREHLPAVVEPTPDELDNAAAVKAQLEDGAVIRILFVGGDERQARHDAAVIDALAAKYPSIAVQFEHPGWGSNWAPVCDQIEAHLRDYDALVLSYLVRTNMGRRVRKMCDAETPWYPSTGTGPGVITDSIVRAATQVVNLRRKAPKI